MRALHKSQDSVNEAIGAWNRAIDGMVKAGKERDLNYALKGIQEFFDSAIAVRAALKESEEE